MFFSLLFFGSKVNLENKENQRGEDYRLALKLANTTKLRGREIAKIASTKTMKNIKNPGLEQNRGLGINQMKSSSRPPPSDPMKRPFQIRSPGSRKNRQRIALSRQRFSSVVIDIVRHHCKNQVAEIVIVVFGGGMSVVMAVVFFGGDGGELVDQVVEVVEPGSVETGEVESIVHLDEDEREIMKKKKNGGLVY